MTTVPLLINKALERIPVLTVFNFAPVANSYEQDLTAQQSWLTNRAWVRAVALLSTGGDQVQTLTETGSPNNGTFTISYYNSQSGTTVTTNALNYGISAANMQIALRAFPDLGSVTVTQTGSVTNFVWAVTMTGADPYMPVFSTNSASLLGGSSPLVTPTITTQRGTMRSLDGTAIKRNGHVFLQTTRQFLTTDRLYVWVMKPAYYHCRTSSTTAWGSQATGLTAEAHECVPDEDLVAFGALTLLARRELNTISKAEQSAIAMQGPRWAKTFRELSQERWETDRDASLELHEQIPWGPGPSWGTGSNRPGWWR